MPTLRTFSLYAKTAAQSVFAYPCNLVDFDGNLIAGAAGSFLQFHDKATAASAGNVPIKSFYLASAGPTPLPSIFQALGPVSFVNGLSIGISSSEATYTAQTATFDIFGEIEEGTQSTDSLTGLTSGSGDYSLGSFEISTSSPTALKRLVSLTVVAADGDCYPVIHTSILGNGQKPAIQLPFQTNGTTVTYYFGTMGLANTRFLQYSATGNQTYSFALSSTGGTFTSVGASSTLSFKYRTT